MIYKVGNSIDIHKLEKGAPLYIGGVLVESEFGSISHSDGDALSHCVCEAILGALGRGDLGEAFPSNKLNKGRRSTDFLKICSKYLKNDGYKISNLDIMIVLEKPKLSTYKAKIAENLGTILECDSSLINIKAGTNEKIGSIGNNESYLCWASILIYKES